MNLFERFEILKDPRDIRGKRYKLIDVLIMTIYAILCNQTDYVNIAYFMKIKEGYFKELLDLENGTPSHDCLSDLFSVIDSENFMRIFIEWVKEIVYSPGNRFFILIGVVCSVLEPNKEKTELILVSLVIVTFAPFGLVSRARVPVLSSIRSNLKGQPRLKR